MIREIVNAVRARLVTQGCPIPITSGRERNTRAMQSRIVVERMRGVDEALRATAPRTNPRVMLAWAYELRVRIVAKSTKAGATEDDHLDSAYELAKLVITELSHETQARRYGIVSWSSARLPDEEELERDGLQTWPGVVVDLRCSIDAGISETTWAQVAANEAVLGTDFDVTLPTTATVDVELAPGD